MKANNEGLNFSSEFTFFDLYNFERATELNHVRDHKSIVSSESDFVHNDNRIRVLGNTGDMSLMVISKDNRNIGREFNSLRISNLQMLCLEGLYKEEAEKGNNGVNTRNGEETISCNETEPFLNEIWNNYIS